jgi:hypothetical protein
MRMIFFTPKRSITISKLTTISGQTTITSGATLARMGLYQLNAAATTLTLVAQTASDTTLWQTAATKYQRSLDITGGYPATFRLQAGITYVFAVLQVGGTTGNLAGLSGGGGVGVTEKVVSRLLTAQTDLPASVSLPGSTAISAAVVYGFLS